MPPTTTTTSFWNYIGIRHFDVDYKRTAGLERIQPNLFLVHPCHLPGCRVYEMGMRVLWADSSDALQNITNPDLLCAVSDEVGSLSSHWWLSRCCDILVQKEDEWIALALKELCSPSSTWTTGLDFSESHISPGVEDRPRWIVLAVKDLFVCFIA